MRGEKRFPRRYKESGKYAGEKKRLNTLRRRLLSEQGTEEMYIFSPEERAKVIVLYLVSLPEPVFMGEKAGKTIGLDNMVSAAELTGKLKEALGL